MKIILKYFPDLTQEQIEKFSQLQDVYREWNDKINVISRKDIDFLYDHHVLHSLAITKFIKFPDNSTVLDVGTGGGFPGIPLAIMFPNCKFQLIDSIAKKIKVVTAVKNDLNLTNVQTEQTRVEKVTEQFNFIVSRAITTFPKFVSIVRKNIIQDPTGDVKNGIVYLKGGEFKNEIIAFRNKVTVYELSDIFKEVYYESKKMIYFPVK